MQKKINHWLPEAHQEITATWTHFENVDRSNSGMSVSSLSIDDVDRFVCFHEDVLGQKVGLQLKVHLKMFGSYMAFMGMLNREIIAIQRFRIYHEYDNSYSSILIAYTGVHPDYRGRGYGTDLRNITKQYILAQSSVAAIFSEVDADNLASRRSLEKIGFKHIGNPINNSHRVLYRVSR